VSTDDSFIEYKRHICAGKERSMNGKKNVKYPNSESLVRDGAGVMNADECKLIATDIWK
jgi:hypothetical protein